MSTVYKLTIYQTMAAPTDIHGNPVLSGPVYAAQEKHLVAKEYFDTNQKAVDRETYYRSTYPSATLSFEITSVTVG